MTLLITLSPFLVLLLCWEGTTFATYGGFVPKHIQELFMNLDENKLTLNMFNSNILNTDPFIAKSYSIFSKYYINDIGRVPRWSPLHKQIKHYFKVAKQKDLKNKLSKLPKHSK